MTKFLWGPIGIVIVVLSIGCSSRDRAGPGPERDASTGSDSTTGADRNVGDRPNVGDASDPFDPNSACGAATIPTQRVPGSLLIVFDASGSMDSPPSGDSGPTKWDLARGGISSVLTSLSDDLSMGLMLFPTGASGSQCSVSLGGGVPEVPMGPLSTTRSPIMSALNITPNGGVTPIFNASRAGYQYLDTLTGPGQKGLIVVTDGAENCDEENENAFQTEVGNQLSSRGYRTYVVGLTQENNTLSQMAVNGGTRRTPTCLPECTADSCFEDSDCSGTQTCESLGLPFPGGLPIPGFCSCASNADCPMPLTCQQPPIPGLFPAQCGGAPNCCHYNAAEGNFQADFETALGDIAQEFLDSCIFEVPRSDDPSMFDPNRVNVGVTFTGQPRQVLSRSSDATMNSWNYTSGANDTLIIQGPICDQLLAESADVEIVLGCPTILL
ncbi:MAG: vWA domain-containing protein [Myxococcota bacterium]